MPHIMFSIEPSKDAYGREMKILWLRDENENELGRTAVQIKEKTLWYANFHVLHDKEGLCLILLFCLIRYALANGLTSLCNSEPTHGPSYMRAFHTMGISPKSAQI